MKLFKKESKIEKEEYFSFCVEGIYKHKNGELFVLGIVDGIILKIRFFIFDRSLWLWRKSRDSRMDRSRILSKIIMHYWLINVFQEEIDQGYIFTNKK